MRVTLMSILLLAASLMDQSAISAARSKTIDSLPGLSAMPEFRMHSGYLETALITSFYWLHECINSSSNTLIIWFNGGPGCSSLYGMFEENGPFKIDGETQNLTVNPNSWNKLGHLLYIESPQGVGFDVGQTMGTNDVYTMVSHTSLLEEFFDMHQGYKNYDIYLTGQSYAGVYLSHLVPQLHNGGYNVRGMMVFNGLFDHSLNLRTRVDYAYYHGIIQRSLWKDFGAILDTCISSDASWNETDNQCDQLFSSFNDIVFKRGLNPYNILKTCHNFSTNTNNSGSMGTDCEDVAAVKNYLNRRDVQEAINAIPHSKPTKKWEICNDEVFNNYDRMDTTVKSDVKQILSSNITVWLVYGDMDLICNFMGGQKFADRLGMQETKPRSEWYVETDDRVNMAGYYKEMNHLSYYIVKGSGHAVPKDKPVEAYQLLARMIQQTEERNSNKKK